MLIPQENINLPVSKAHSHNLLLAICLDGAVYGIDETSGRVLWRSIGTFSEGPLLSRRRKGEADAEAKGMDYLVEPLGEGSLFQVNRSGGDDGEMKRLPFTLKGLVQMSPVYWRESENRAVYLIAKRESSIFMLNLLTGAMERRQFNGDNKYEDDETTSVDIPSLDRTNVLLVGRTDYHVQGFDDGHLEAQWEIILTQFKSLHHHAEDEPGIGHFYTTFNGHLVSKQRSGPSWIAELSGPVLQVFRPVLTAKGDAITLREVSLKGSNFDETTKQQHKNQQQQRQQHVLFDNNRATFYFDDFVNVGSLADNNNSSSFQEYQFVLPQSRYPVVPIVKKPKKYRNVLPGDRFNGHENHENVDKGNVEMIVHFESLQRVTRQSVPAAVKLIGHESVSGGSLVYTMTAVLGGLSVLLALLWFYRRRLRFQWEGRKESLLQVDEADVLGYGSHGTVVFRGRFDGRAVAVKRLLSDFYSLAEREIGLLQMHDTHPNVIRYFYREQVEKFILVALELANATLDEFVGEQKRPIGVKVSILRQMMEGIDFLHGHNVIHRDLKPQNILLQFGGSEGVKVLISDFGLSRKLVETTTLDHATAKASGTLGWRAPEVIFNDESVKFQELNQSNAPSISGGGVVPMKIKKSIDIFAAGLIFYFVLSDGEHAFGPRMVRESNISLYRPQIDSSLLSFEAENLIRAMLSKAPQMRPSARRVLSHPFFWRNEERLAFICAVSDLLEAEERKFKQEQPPQQPSHQPSHQPSNQPSHQPSNLKPPPGFDGNPQQQYQLVLRDSIDSLGPIVFNNETNNINNPSSTWHRQIDRIVFQDLTRHRYYMVNKLHDLLRAIRNKRNHFPETPTNVQAIIGTDPGQMWCYYEEKFPRLLMETYGLMREKYEDGQIDVIKSPLEKYFSSDFN